MAKNQKLLDRMIDLDTNNPFVLGSVGALLGVLTLYWNSDAAILSLVFGMQIWVFLLTLAWLKKPLLEYKATAKRRTFLIRNMGFFSLFVPGSGHIAFGAKSKGLLLLVGAAIIEYILLVHYRGILLVLPASLFLLWNVYDTDRLAKSLK